MKNIHIYLIAPVFFSICSCKSSPSRVYFYYRTEIGVNNYKSYYDHLAITEYENKRLTAMDFFKYAKQYLDTTKAELPIDIVNFVGKSHWGSLPKGNWSTMKDQKRYMIISFGFNSKVDPVKYNSYNLTLVSVYRNGKSTYFTKLEIDSVMHSAVPLDNGND